MLSVISVGCCTLGGGFVWFWKGAGRAPEHLLQERTLTDRRCVGWGKKVAP